MAQDKMMDKATPEWILNLLEEEITYELLNDPYFIKTSGKTYSKTTIDMLLSKKKPCPMTTIPFGPDDIVVDNAMNNILAYFEDPQKATTMPWDLFFCSITKKPFVHPVVAEDGNIYELEAIENHLRNNNNLLPNQQPQRNALTAHVLIKNICESEEFQTVLKQETFIDKKSYEAMEWAYAKFFLKDKNNGYHLTKNSLLDENLNLLKPKLKNAKKFEPHDFKNLHSFMKFNEEIYRVQDEKNTLGSQAKIKYMENEKGDEFVAKIINTTEDQFEYFILENLNLLKGKGWRLDKNKYYVVMPNLGKALHSQLALYDINITKRKPDVVARKTVYLYLENNQLTCCYIDASNHTQEIILKKDALLNHYQEIKTLINSSPRPAMDSDVITKNDALQADLMQLTGYDFPYIICKERPNSEVLKVKIFYLYENKGGLRYAFKYSNQLRAESRVEINRDFKSYNTILFQIENLKLGKKPDLEPEVKKSVFAALGLNSIALDDDARLKLAIDICLQVANLHCGTNSREKTTFSHLDIKPENIVIDQVGNVHLIDFGLSELEPKNIRKTTGGTESYMPSYSNYPMGLTGEQFDMVALKRVLFFPLEFDMPSGFSTTEKWFQDERSVLTSNILTQFNLNQYINTSNSVHHKKNDANDVLTAVNLAAILIIARLNLSKNYYEIVKIDTTLSENIIAVYEKEKSNINLANIMVETIEESIFMRTLQASTVDVSGLQEPKKDNYPPAFFKPAINVFSPHNIPVQRDNNGKDRDKSYPSNDFFEENDIITGLIHAAISKEPKNVLIFIQFLLEEYCKSNECLQNPHDILLIQPVIEDLINLSILPDEERLEFLKNQLRQQLPNVKSDIYNILIHFILDETRLKKTVNASIGLCIPVLENFLYTADSLNDALFSGLFKLISNLKSMNNPDHGQNFEELLVPEQQALFSCIELNALIDLRFGNCNLWLEERNFPKKKTSEMSPKVEYRMGL